ncbi:unnamed protein product [Peronospora belbahrii]|uniref:Serine/threonine-protein phosphatase 1 regulatory subunit 10 n=1 Tax=Peronospora belbahrii TaxID=622444 RepID=A0AAU9KNC3_9STRA|nr:unnamed protein product [Peronospora belbahrii]
MNMDMERTSFTSMLEDSQFGGPLHISQQPLMHAQAQSAFGFHSTMAMDTPQFMKQQSIEQQAPPLASVPVQLPADQSIPDMLQSTMSRSNSCTLTPSNAEAFLLSLVDCELCVSSISNLPIFLQFLPRCKTEPEQTLALVVLRATSTASDTKLSRACAGAFEKSGGLHLARTWVDSAVTWQHNDLLVLLLEVLQTLPLQLTSITEARINEPIVKLRKNACDERVKRAAQDLLKFWRGKFTEKEKSSVASVVAQEKTHETFSANKPSSSSTSSAKQVPAIAASSNASKTVPSKQPKVTKKRTIKRLERLPFGGGSAVSKSSDLIGNLMQRKSAKDAATAAAEVEKKNTSSKSTSSSKSDIMKNEETKSRKSSSAKDDSISADDTLSMPLPTIQSFKVVSSTGGVTKERKCIRWADESGEELVMVKLIESWRDLVPHDPRHDDQSFKDAKLREHANERHALLAQHHKVPPAVVASRSREWTTPPFIRLPEDVAKRVDGNTVTDEMHVQDSRRRHVDEYEVLAGEMPIASPKEWERVNDPHRGPPLEIPLSDVIEGNASNQSPPRSAPMMVAPATSSSRERYSSGGYVQTSRDYDQRGFSRSEYNGCQDPDADRKLREVLGPLQENTVSLLLDCPDVVPQVLEEAQRHGNRISDARVFEIVDQYRRGRYQAPPPVGSGQPPSYSPYGSQQQQQQQQQQQHFGDMGPGTGYGHQYQQQYPPQQGPLGGPFVSGNRKTDALNSLQNGLMPDALQSHKRLTKKARSMQPCRFFTSPIGCKHGGNCHYAHIQPVPANGPELIYNNSGPMMGGRGGGHMERYGHVGMSRGNPSHQVRGGR